MAKPRKGVIPPHLRKFLFKKGKKRKATRRVRAKKKTRIVRRRRKNPAPLRHARRSLARSVYGIITAERGKTRLSFDGRHFSAKHAPRKFPTLSMAEATARRLLKTYPVLRGYKVYIRTAH